MGFLLCSRDSTSAESLSSISDAAPPVLVVRDLH
jgi:hypothetical protein